MDYVIVRAFALRHRRDRKVVSSLPVSDDQARRYAAVLLSEAREELSRVDTKASIMLAAVGVAIGVVLGDLASRSWSPFRLPLAAALAWWAGSAAVGAGTVLLLAAVYPRHRQLPRDAGEPSGGLGYYADVAAYRSASEVVNAIRRSVKHDLELMAEQLLQVSRIADRKYRLLRCGVWLLAVGAALSVCALLINAA